jgi:transcriptional regulator with XRE-family HTH domain
MYLPIGDRLKKLRTEANLSRIKLAELAGISCKTIINIENNKYSPTRKTALKLINILNVPTATLTVNATDFFSLDIRTQFTVLRLSLCLSQKEFANLCNFDSSTIRDWELGKRELNVVNKMFVSKILTFCNGKSNW